MTSIAEISHPTMEIDDGRVLAALSKKLGAMKTDEEPTRVEKKLVKRIVALIGSWKAGDVEEEEQMLGR